VRLLQPWHHLRLHRPSSQWMKPIHTLQMTTYGWLHSWRITSPDRTIVTTHFYYSEAKVWRGRPLRRPTNRLFVQPDARTCVACVRCYSDFRPPLGWSCSSARAPCIVLSRAFPFPFPLTIPPRSLLVSMYVFCRFAMIASTSAGSVLIISRISFAL
jgi:hypothetical protein